MKIFDNPALGGVATVPSVGIRHRRSWTLEQKLAILAELDRSGDPVAVVARRHGMNANHLFNWIQARRAGTLGRRGRPAQAPEPDVRTDIEDEQGFIDLGIFSREEMASALNAGCLLEVDLPSGLRMRVPLSVEPELLTRAVRALRAI